MEINGRAIGPGQPVYLIAEAGSNHNGDYGTALGLIAEASRAGVDAIKFQFFRADSMVAKDHPDYETFKKYEIPEHWLPLLQDQAEYCHLGGLKKIEVFYSVFSPEHVAILNPYVNVWKIASAELTYRPLLEAVAATGKPVILSTGMSTWVDTDNAMNIMQNRHNCAILQCVSAYPAPPEEMNLMVLSGTGTGYYCPAGLSDHTAEPFAAPLMAAALGASIIEKHFGLTREGPSPDAPFSIIPSELKQLATALHSAHLMLGDGIKKVQPSEVAALSDRRVLIGERWLRGYPN